MNLIPADPNTGGLIGGYSENLSFHLYGIVSFPDIFPLQKITLPYFVPQKDPAFTPGELLLTRKEKIVPAVTFYCDSVAGGKDFSGIGTKEDPCRNLAWLLKKIFCRQEKALISLFRTGFVIRIFLKGVVDYEMDLFPFELGGPFPYCCKDVFLIVSRWGEEEAIFDSKELAIGSGYFKNITFRNVETLEGEDRPSTFEGCVFSSLPQMHHTGKCDFYKCSIVIGDLLSFNTLRANSFKECQILWSLRAGDIPSAGFPPELSMNYMEDCEVTVNGENLFIGFNKYSEAGNALPLLRVRGCAVRTHFAFALSDPPHTDSVPYNYYSLSIKALILEGTLVDSTVTVSAEHNFDPVPEDLYVHPDDEASYQHLFISGISGTSSDSCVRCKVISISVSGKNAKKRFCSFMGSPQYGAMKLVECSGPSGSTGNLCQL